ncbi:MAG: hypothetical protein COV29_02965 [Candidatus Yanofskybacteria bacterium CG10_big_fil_rev_8_21_14_0_10_36_16]|uniref:Uncharacterized protein n=1 Tax=Candidatus Yanofskybacteria bacterium CG10_big_fil_rev_8_21_14_0_10_36_16 TaxID=1975096 RepID=A0A2J0Q700_9BACT|nr:MAG: hypothetical protein COV29_02965 [Candidatus Yanofskybacteria bacterium CG10_big_fil_rev_8_21_14_0_10_36_16]
MKKITKTVVTYKCSLCEAEYQKASEAEKCESRILEEKVFKVGDKVENIELRFCAACDITYRFKGKVVKVIGPVASDYEYEAKWLKGAPERLNGHVFQYQVRFECPHCHRTREERYFAPELKKI